LKPCRCAVNKYAASRFINNKSVQLLLARACGMKVPTLMANSPQAVREYFRDHPQRMISNPSTHIWQKEQGGRRDVCSVIFQLKRLNGYSKIIAHLDGMNDSSRIMRALDLEPELMQRGSVK
jgi:hypothetical protein